MAAAGTIPVEEFIEISDSEKELLETVTIQIKSRADGGVRVNKNQPGERFGVSPKDADYLCDERKVAVRCFSKEEQEKIWAAKRERLQDKKRAEHATRPEQLLQRLVALEKQNELLLSIIQGNVTSKDKK